LIQRVPERQCTVSHLELDELFAGMPGDENENVALAHLGPVGPDDDVSMVVK
jgi:hypothetical protein